MPDQRLAGDRMLALGKPFELVFANVAGEPPPLRELAVPDAANQIALGVVVVAGVLKLLGVIAACLSRAERLRDREHGHPLLEERLLFHRRLFVRNQHLRHG